ncbi:MAG: hypothetical protein IJP48_07025 [Synergistaceae bacterium]|nr:hypothetical protein [Synergistaceae bacterium]
MSNLISKDNLQAASQRSKTFTNEKILELANATIEAFQELTAAVTASELVDFFAASGLYIDEDGDIAQHEDSEAEEEEVENG